MVAFVGIVETGSLSAAARRLGTTQPSISRQLVALEKRLKAQLLRRNTRHLSLTEAGQNYYESCKRILADVDETEGNLATSQLSPKGTLRVNTSVALGVDYIGPLACKFHMHHPELAIDLTLNERHVDLTEEGIDLAIRFGQIQGLDLIARKLGTTRLLTVAAPCYLERHGVPTHPSDIARHACVAVNYIENSWTYHGPDGNIAVKIAGQFRSNNGHVVREAIIAGLGIGILPEALIWQQCERGLLTALFPDYPMALLPVHAVYPYSAHIPAKVRAFVTYLVEQFQGLPCFIGAVE